MPEFNPKRAANALADAAFATDAIAAKKYRVTSRSLRSWRSRLKWDADLQAEYEIALSDRKAAMITVPKAIEAALDYLRRACHDSPTNEPESIRAITEALATLSEVQLVELKLKEIQRELDRASPETDSQ